MNGPGARKPGDLTLARSERGIAVLGAMLITVVVVAVAATVGVRSMHDIAATARLLEVAAASEVFAALERDSQAMLTDDGMAEPVDALDEDWAKATFTHATAAAQGDAHLRDLQGLFNLNTLAFDPSLMTAVNSAQPAQPAQAAGAADEAENAVAGTETTSAGAQPAASSTRAPGAAIDATQDLGNASVPPGMKLIERPYVSNTGRTTRYYDVIPDPAAQAGVGAGAADVGNEDGDDVPAGARPTADAQDSSVDNAAMAALANLPEVSGADGNTSGEATGGAPGQPVQLSPHQVAVARFSLLLSALDIDSAVLAAVLDWLDPDSDARFPNGAEDDYYTELERPYRTGNRSFADVCELKLVRGVTAEVFDKLAPYLTVLPDFTAINVNTAPVEVLMSLGPGIDRTAAEMIVNARDTQAFQSLADFLAVPVLAGRPLTSIGLATSSAYFALDMDVSAGRSALLARSVLGRSQPQTVQLVNRAKGFLDE